MAEVRPELARAGEPAHEALDADALARRLGVSRRTAYRRLDAMFARQHDPDVLRVVKIPVPIGSGATREALHVLWPRPDDTAAANDT